MSRIVTTTPQSKKRILYVITKSNMGGAQRYVYDLATNLPKERFDVVVAMGGSGMLKERLNLAMIRTIEVTSFTRNISPVRDISTFFELITLFRNERPDVVHLNSAKAVTVGALAARIARVPRIISTVHGWAHNEPRPWFQKILIRTVERIGTMLAHTTIVVAKADAQWGAIAIHNGMREPLLCSREEARKILRIAPDAFVVGSIGEFTRNKNYAALIEAVKHTDVTLVLIGEGEEQKKLRRMANEQTVFTGYIPDASNILRAFDMFVLPSKKEGLPYVLLAAGTARLPVIATNVGGVPEIITDGITGTLVKSGSPSAIKTAINRYRNNPELRNRHGEALHNHVRTSFVLTRMVDQTVAQY
jgi:glycosyltransferase involved in cell wall biosynthesis